MDKNRHALSDLHANVLKPALISIPDACRYLGGVSRAKLYADLLPQLETVHIGKRHFVLVASLDRLIAQLNGASAPSGAPSKRGRLRNSLTPEARA